MNDKPCLCYMECWMWVSSALNRANPGVLCGRCCGMCESLDITSPWWMRDPPVWGGEKGRALAIGPPLLSVFLNGSVFVGFSLSSLFFFS